MFLRCFKKECATFSITFCLEIGWSLICFSDMLHTMSDAMKHADQYLSFLHSLSDMGAAMKKVITRAVTNPNVYKNLTECKLFSLGCSLLSLVAICSLLSIFGQVTCYLLVNSCTHFVGTKSSSMYQQQSQENYLAALGTLKCSPTPEEFAGMQNAYWLRLWVCEVMAHRLQNESWVFCVCML